MYWYYACAYCLSRASGYLVDMEISNIGSAIMELLSTFFGSFSPSTNAVQFVICWITVFGAIALIWSLISEKGGS